MGAADAFVLFPQHLALVAERLELSARTLVEDTLHDMLVPLSITLQRPQYMMFWQHPEILSNAEVEVYFMSALEAAERLSAIAGSLPLRPLRSWLITDS